MSTLPPVTISGSFIIAVRSPRIAVAAENPSFGADYSFVRDDLQRYECISHAIYYRTTASGILVLRILHGRMDPGQHLI